MGKASDFESLIDRYCQALGQVSKTNLGQVLALCADKVEFKDPFNHTRTRGGFENVLEDMYKRIPDAQFTVASRFGSGRDWVIKWTFTGSAGRLGVLEIPGLSEVQFDETGLVCRHIDFWDSGQYFWKKVPVIGHAISAITRRFEVPD